jgi:phospholipase D1/2
VRAFLGCLDLCAGRYDTPSHRLFRDLNTVFHSDVYNPLFGVRLARSSAMNLR